MADALDYVDPIIKAMLASVEAKQNASRQELQKKAQSDESAARKEQLALEKQRLQHESDASHAAHDLTAQQIELTRAQQEFTRRLALLDKVKEYIGEGAPASSFTGASGNPNKNAPPIINIPGLGSINIDPNSLPSAQQRIQTEADKAGRIAGATTQAQQNVLNPIEQSRAVRDQGFDISKLNLQNQNSLALEAKKAEDAAKAQTLLFAHQKALNDADNATAMLVARTRLSNAAKDLNETAVSNAVNDLYVNGNPTAVPAAVKRQVLNNAPAGWHQITQGDIKVLKSIPLLQNIVDTTEELNNLIKANPVTGRLQYTTNAGEIGDLKKKLTGLMGNISTSLSGEVGRKTEGDIDRARGLVFNMLSFDYGKAKELQKILADAVGGTLSQFKDPAQLAKVIEAHDIKPEVINNFTNKPTQDKKDPLGLFK